MKRKRFNVIDSATSSKAHITELAAEWEQAGRREYTSPCKMGCNHCCRQMVVAGLYEGVVIANHLLSTGQGARLEKIVAQGKEQEELGAAKWFQKNEACALLNEDGLCSIYHIRPVACATYLAVDQPQEELDKQARLVSEEIGEVVEALAPPEACAPPQVMNVATLTNHVPIAASMQIDGVYLGNLLGDKKKSISVPIPLGRAIEAATFLLRKGVVEFRKIVQGI